MKIARRLVGGVGDAVVAVTDACRVVAHDVVAANLLDEPVRPLPPDPDTPTIGVPFNQKITQISRSSGRDGPEGPTTELLERP